MTSPDPDSTLDLDRRVLELLERCLELSEAEAQRLLEECRPEVAGQVRELLRGGALDAVLETPPVNPLEDLVRESVLPAGARIGSYEVLGPLGEGGVGRVYLARQDAPRREVALKTLRSNLASPESVARFRVEAELLARLEHPNIARVFEAGIGVVELEGRRQEVPFFALEVVRGAATLTDWAAAARPEQRALLQTFRKVVDALHHAHQRGVIHRDLKPVNVLVDETGEPKVIDFGIARAEQLELADQVATRLGQVLGTPATMAPEQLLSCGADLDVRVDVFALGAMLYELLCGRALRDLTGVSTQAAMRRALLVDPPRPRKLVKHLAPDLEAIVLKAIAPEREDRYPSAEALGDDLRRFLDYETVRARRPRLRHQALLFVRRNRWTSAALLAAVLGLVGTSAWAQWNAARAGRAERAQVAATLRVEGLRIAAIDASLSYLSEFVDELAKLPGSVEERVALLGLAAEQLDELEREQALDPPRRARVAQVVIELAALLGKPGRTNLGRREEALAAYERALEIAARVERDDPDRGLLLRLRVELDRSNLALFDQNMERVRAISEHAEERFAAFLDPTSPSGLRDSELEPELAGSLRGLYQAHLALRTQLHLGDDDPARAIETMQRSMRISEVELARQPGDMIRELNVALFKSNLAVLLTGQGRDEEALELLAETIATYERYLASGQVDPGKMGPRLTEKYIVRAEVEGSLERHADQEASAREVLAWTEPARVADPNDVHNLTMHFTGLELLGAGLAGRGLAARDAGRPDEARELLGQARERLQRALEFESEVRQQGTLWHPDQPSRVARRLDEVIDLQRSLEGAATDSD